MNGSAIDFSDPKWITAIIGVTTVVVTISWKFYRAIMKWSMLALSFVDKEPPGERIIDWGFAHDIHLGRSEHWIKVRSNTGLNLADFSVRFIPNDSGDQPVNLSHLIVVEDLIFTRGIRDLGIAPRISDDGYGGKDVHFDIPYPLGEGQSFFLKVIVNAKNIWSGRFSFRGLDNDRIWRYSRAEVRVIPNQQAITSGIDDESSQGRDLMLGFKERNGSYYHTQPIQEPGLGKGQLQLHRISLTGKRRRTIENVQVKVEKLIPPSNTLRGVNFHLQLMNDNIQPFQGHISLEKDQTEYFDVIGYAQFMLDTGRLHFRRIDGVSGEVEGDDYEVQIRVTAKELNSILARFRIHIDDHNDVRMALLNVEYNPP